MESAVLTSLGGRSYRFDTFCEKLILRMYGPCLPSFKSLELVQRFTDPPDADSEPGTGTDKVLRCAPRLQDFVLTGPDEVRLATAPSGLASSSRSLGLSSTTLRTTESARRGQITDLFLDEVLVSDTYLCRSPNAFPFPGFFHSVIGYDCATVRRTNDDDKYDIGASTDDPNIVVLGQLDSVERKDERGKMELT